jgi:hypothetical protein
MAPFQYDTPSPSPLAGSIADIILRGGDIRAREAMTVADANAQSAAQRAALWGRTIQTLGAMPTQMMEQTRQNQLAQSEIALRNTQIQGAQQQLAAQQAQQQGERYLASTIQQNTNPDTGEIDAPKVASLVSAQYPGVGEKWLALHADGQADLEKLATTKRAHDNAQTIAIANAANKATDLPDFVARIGTARVTQGLTPQRIAQLQRDLGDGSDWDTARQRLIDAGDEVAPPLITKEGETIKRGISGTVLSAQPKQTVVPAGSTVLQDGKVTFTAPEKPLADPELDALAKSLYGDKADRSSLTYGDIQTARNAKQVADDARKLQLSKAETAARVDYENTHPKPPPPPVVLNAHQQGVAKDLATGTLTFSEFNRLFPNRSGAGAEAKAAMYDAARELNPAFSPAQFEAGYKMATNPQVTNRLVAINALMPVVDRITTLAASVGNNDIPAFNRLLQEGNFQVGGKHVASLRQLQTLLGEEVGNALGVGTGSDLKTKLGLDLVNPTLGPKDFLDTMQQLSGVLGARKQTLLGTMGVYGQGPNAVPAAQAPGGGGMQVGKYNVTRNP